MACKLQRVVRPSHLVISLGSKAWMNLSSCCGCAISGAAPISPKESYSTYEKGGTNVSILWRSQQVHAQPGEQSYGQCLLLLMTCVLDMACKKCSLLLHKRAIMFFQSRNSFSIKCLTIAPPNKVTPNPRKIEETVRAKWGSKDFLTKSYAIF